MKKENRQKGITLVALVITIIILLILAGISISALTESGLFEKAKEAKQKSENAQNLENQLLAEYKAQIDNLGGTTEGTGSSGGTGTTGGSSFTNVDKSKTNPEAAKPSEATVIEADAEKGIVIKDKKDNEWTWVEVPKTIFATATSDIDYDNIKADLISYATDYRGSWTDEWYSGCGIVDATTYITMYNKMLSSVYTNGGFWISRYEIGDSTSTEGNITRTDSSETTGIAVSKANKIPYNYVTCSQAQTLASGMSTDSNKISSLLFGIQWDLACKYLEGKDGLVTADINSDSTSWGNYYNATVTSIKTGAKQLISSVWTEKTDAKLASSSILLTTGASEYANKMNIYDFAGNVWEWTLEKASSSSGPCATRGGYYDHKGSFFPASGRSGGSISSGGSASSSGDYIGFRSALY